MTHSPLKKKFVKWQQMWKYIKWCKERIQFRVYQRIETIHDRHATVISDKTCTNEQKNPYFLLVEKSLYDLQKQSKSLHVSI